MVVFQKPEITSITPNLKLHEFVKWGPVYEISFDLLIEESKNSLYNSILTFTENVGQCCRLGDRIPGVYLRTDIEEFHIATQIGADGNSFNDITKYDLNKWYHILIKQYQIDEKWVINFIYSDSELQIIFFSILRQV